MTISIKPVLAFIILTAPMMARAELHECNGTWTNKPCENGVGHKLSEGPSKTRSKEEIERDQKNLWLHDLDMKRLKAQRDYKVVVDTSDARLLCDSASGNLIECRRTITARENLIDQRILDAKALELKKQEIEAAKERDRESSDTNRVTVIQNTTRVEAHIENNIGHQDIHDQFDEQPESPVSTPTPTKPSPRLFSTGKQVIGK